MNLTRAETRDSVAVPPGAGCQWGPHEQRVALLCVSQVVCWWSIRCFIAPVKLRTAQVAFCRAAGGRDGAGGSCVALYCAHRSQVRCLTSAASLFSHYTRRRIVYDFTGEGHKLAGFTKTWSIF